MPLWGTIKNSDLAGRGQEERLLRETSIVKNNGNEGLKLSKVRRGKCLAQIFSKDLTERKLERTKMKIMLSPSPWLFHTKFRISDLRREFVFYPN